MFCWFALALLLPHELPDGHVERSIQVVIHDDRVVVHYAVGLNDVTLARWLGPDWPAEQLDFDAYAQHALERVACGLQVRLGGRSVQLTPMKIEPAARHHSTFETTFEFPAPETGGQVALALDDNNFEELAGNIRLALKPKGRAIVSNSNVSPLVVRADRIKLDELSASARAQVCRIRATIVMP